MLFVHEKELIEESLDVQRRGDYLGKTVQVIPHVTDAIQDWVEKVAHQPVDESGKAPEVCIIEVSSVVQFSRMKTGKLKYEIPFLARRNCWRYRIGTFR